MESLLVLLSLFHKLAAVAGAGLRVASLVGRAAANAVFRSQQCVARVRDFGGMNLYEIVGTPSVTNGMIVVKIRHYYNGLLATRSRVVMPQAHWDEIKNRTVEVAVHAESTDDRSSSTQLEAVDGEMSEGTGVAVIADAPQPPAASK